MTPKISVIVPCYNQAQYLDECLQSVLDQTYQNWECMIVNDGSPDYTAEIAASWVAKDNRFKYIYKENGGLSSARNAGIEMAEGEYILPLDADDKIGNDYVFLALKEFEKDIELKVVYCLAEKFGTETRPWILPEFSLSLICCENMIFCSAFFKKEDWKLAGGFDTNLIYGIEDWEFWIAILKNGGKVIKINRVCFYYRIKKNSMVKELDYKKLKYSYNYINIKHADLYIKEFGSFFQMQNEFKKSQKELTDKLKS